MRDDLLDPHSAVDWAVTQIPTLQEKLTIWNRKRPYDLSVEDDPNTGQQFLVARPLGAPSPSFFNVEVGAIINGIRTALDLLASALARRNGVNPSQNTHFPIFSSEQEMIDPLEGIEGKKWLSQGERATIKSLKPYKGGDETLWSLHQLDIARKHYRLVDVSFHIASAFVTIRPANAPFARKRLDDKAILFPLPRGSNFSPSEGNSNLTLDITFDEAGVGLTDQPIVPALRRFAERVSEIINIFDTP